MFQPRKIRGERAEPRRADEQPDEDEADHGREAEAREGGDYNARRAEHHQRVADGGGFCFGYHKGRPYAGRPRLARCLTQPFWLFSATHLLVEVLVRKSVV